MRIPTNEENLRENLHEAVENLSIVNIIILLVLIRAVQVISWLRPSERDIKALPAPAPELPELPEPSETPGLDSQPPPYRFGTFPENYPGIASITESSGPEPGSGEITIQDRDGRDWTFQEWYLEQERQRLRHLGRGRTVVPLASDEVVNYYTDADGLHQRTELTTTILGWALTDCNERLILICHPSGEFRIDRFDQPGDVLIEAPQYTRAHLEYECTRHNQFNEYARDRNIRYHRHHYGAYCTPSRDGVYTGSGIPEPLSYGSPRNRNIGAEWERRIGQLQNGRHTGPIRACSGIIDRDGNEMPSSD